MDSDNRSWIEDSRSLPDEDLSYIAARFCEDDPVLIQVSYSEKLPKNYHGPCLLVFMFCTTRSVTSPLRTKNYTFKNKHNPCFKTELTRKKSLDARKISISASIRPINHSVFFMCVFVSGHVCVQERNMES